ncbi:MAG: ABC transporter permease subunit [Myxococcales bacterium]|nr:ABC transporter permease subunit [Myxococcales bacterium]
MATGARVAARVAIAWLATWLLGWTLLELAADPPAVVAARAGSALPPDGGRAGRDQVVARVAAELDLDGGGLARTGRALVRAAILAPGPSWRDRRPAGAIARAHAGATLARASAATVLALAAGVLAPLALARRRRAAALVAVGGGLGLSVPLVWLCHLALAVAPTAALSSTMAVVLVAVAPAAVIALHVGAALARADHGPLAVAVRARGASRRRWHAVHALALVAPGLAPLAASTIAFALAASPVVERALALPGAGRTLVAAAAVGDAPVLLTLAAGAAAVVALVGGLGHALARRLDPRLEAGA